MSEEHAKQLGPKLEKLRRDIASFAQDDVWEGLLPVWQRPGWTSPAEVQFAVALLDTLIAQVGIASSLKIALDKCSRAVKTN